MSDHDLINRLRQHERGSRQQCTCRSHQANCLACDCGLAADGIERLCGIIENRNLVCADYLAEIERLRAKLRNIANHSTDPWARDEAASWTTQQLLAAEARA